MKIQRLIPMLAAVLAAVILPPWTAAPAFAVDKAGEVVWVRGKAVIERSSGKANARVASPLLESDRIETRDKSRVKMLFLDDSILTLGANSRLNIKKYLSSPESKRAESIYELADGRLRSVVGGPGFKVTTPTAFAAARGTVFTVSYDIETGVTKITVLEGTVEVRNVNAEVAGMQTVSAGQTTTVASGQPPTPPQPAGGGSGDEEGGGVNITVPDGGGGGPGLPVDMTGAGLSLAPPIEQEPLHALSSVLVDVVFPR